MLINYPSSEQKEDTGTEGKVGCQKISVGYQDKNKEGETMHSFNGCTNGAVRGGICITHMVQW